VALGPKGESGMKPVVPRGFPCRATGVLCTDGDCTRTLCGAETRALADADRKAAVKASRDATALPRRIVDEMIKRLRNPN
jgi:hypothetical protein